MTKKLCNYRFADALKSDEMTPSRRGIPVISLKH